MVSTVFQAALRQATGRTWEEWLVSLESSVDRAWPEERVARHITQRYGIEQQWADWLARLYGQLLGRVPVGVTKDAGVQIGVRRTVEQPKERVWRFLVSPAGLALWLGTLPGLPLEVGREFATAEGVEGKLTVVSFGEKLRLTWRRPEWERPSRLQLYVLPTASGKTTIALHQEMLEDVYIRDMMKRHWEAALETIKRMLDSEE